MVFDILLCFILWIVYVQESISTGDIVEALRSEVIHYTFRTSLFDTVILAFLRFIVVEIVYGLFLVRAPWFSGGMTGLTCCVLLTKCFLFNFHRDGLTITGLVYAVLITPLIVTWVETTFLICRVIPQEKAALHVASCLHLDEMDEARSLLGGRLPARRDMSRYSASVGYFTPQGSVFADDIVRLNVPTKTTREAAVDIAALLSRASLLCSELWYLYGLEVWGPDPPAFCDISVRSSNIRDYGTKVFRMEALLDAPAHKVYHDLVYNVRESPSWNKTIDCIECIQSLPSENIDIIYNVIREALGGAISRRDMVLLRTWGERDELFYVGSTSVDHPKFPPTENCVRAQQLINAWVIEPRSDDNSRSKIVWIMCNDLKLFIPQRFVESALNTELPKVLRSLQERARYLRSTADPLHPLERQFSAGTVGTSTLVVNSSNMHRNSTIPSLSDQSIGQSKQLPFI
ncbi:Steroidogenic acute regulatory protein mitochondrial [Fasciola gigantica]|uniref:Steroidogenic acute regulatory protein mitochondrial n=1 Tax=Fasciola gigantica TaxID=46835 RepID=A0A504Z6W7_FASGI|nr:Steroidogenic acute regulatory protein mitochondrial [Fasciola gigantica]